VDNIYLQLTKLFNQGKKRAIISSGQAVVLYKLAIMSKDGDWIIKEEDECTEHILSVLEGYGARYRFGAPLDIRWLKEGWSSHFEFSLNNFRVRTDFVSRPPRVSIENVEKLWIRSEDNKNIIDIENLIELKKTQREKDYPIIGELARCLEDAEKSLLYSRSASDIIEIARRNPESHKKAAVVRKSIATISSIDKLEEALDRERRDLMRKDKERMLKYAIASESYLQAWSSIEQLTDNLPLHKAHQIILDKATTLLPQII